ncbi:MAG: hypothetical protein ACYCY1_14015 [Sulfuriferula sp.]
MSISNIGSNPVISSLQFSGISPVASQGSNSDGDNDGSSVSRVGGNGGRFASAINQALAQIGVTPGSSSSVTGSSTATDPNSTTASTQDPQQALAAFMQNLFASLQSQNSGQTNASNSGTDSDGDRDGSSAASAVSGASGKGHHGHHGGGLGKMESSLQNLIQQISSSSPAAASTDATTDSTTAADSASSSLQQSFQNLLAADGATGSNASLTGFLQALSQNLQGATSSGNVVSTQA